MNDLVRSWGSCKCEKQRGKECVAERGRSKMMDTVNVTGAGTRICLVEDFEVSEDPRTPSLRRISYGIILPTICCFGIVGNILNLVVLTRRNMRGTAYIYMRGYSAAALLAILFCIPFALRVLIHKETGRWRNWMQAFYHTHLELFLGNGCLGVGVMMLLALTVERYVSVCRPGQHTRPLCGPPHLTVALIPLATFLVYLPSVFREEITTCLLAPDGPVIYQKRENQSYLDSMFYQVYKVILEIVFKVAPTILLAGFNLRIMIVYRRSCERRRRMTLSRTASNDEDPRTFAEERRLVLLLGSTSILFLVCVSPMVILNVTLRESNLSHYPYQVFRALANLLEVINYSITFYIYCMFSEDFRNTLIRTLQWPCRKTSHEGRGLPMKRSSIPRPTTTTTTTTTITTTTLPTTAVATPGHLTRASVYWRLVSLFLSYPHQSHLKGEKPRETEFSQPQNSDAVYQSTSSGNALTSIPRLLNIITRYRIHRQILVYRDSRFAYGTNSNQRDIELSFLPSKLSNKKIHQFFTVMHSTLIGSATEPQIYSSD